MRIRSHQNICEWVGAQPDQPRAGSNIGLALSSVGKVPIHGLRHKPTADSNGWFIWCGDYSEADDFFSPICVDHVDGHLPQIKEYLDLPPGYRFLIDSNNYEDVWFDENLLNEN